MVIRFLFNFFLFGLLFYMIWLFFPDAFATLVGWVSKVFEYLRELFNQVSGQMQKNTNPEAVPSETKAMVMSYFFG